jgi:hypothetical protein
MENVTLPLMMSLAYASLSLVTGSDVIAAA